MKTHNILLFNLNKENHSKLYCIFYRAIFSKGLNNEFETAVVNEPSVFEPLKFYCCWFRFKQSILHSKMKADRPKVATYCEFICSVYTLQVKS